MADKILALMSVYRLHVLSYQYLVEEIKIRRIRIFLGIEFVLLVAWDLYHVPR